ncbi:hypothetical protein B0H16DRAFT_1461202 [Mycena metata]|uniref:Uncharacterized protein n=1 Tax=Mycena metata TaxID=1033252 RepID=A0AAD7IU40_9AGAR|nr:hypothetical protein B0H16DRAFT_1461202 [Mycena metata]
MAGIIAQITPPIPIGMQRDLAKFTGNRQGFLHKYLQSFPAESIGTRWATISLVEVRDSHWPGNRLIGGTRCQLPPISRLPPPRTVRIPPLAPVPIWGFDVGNCGGI